MKDLIYKTLTDKVNVGKDQGIERGSEEEPSALELSQFPTDDSNRFY